MTEPHPKKYNSHFSLAPVWVTQNTFDRNKHLHICMETKLTWKHSETDYHIYQSEHVLLVTVIQRCNLIRNIKQ